MESEHRQQLEEARARLRASSEHLVDTVSQAQRDIDKAATVHQEEMNKDRVDERFEEAIRAGRAGRDIQRIQARVDRGEFTWEEALTGRVDDEAVTNAIWRSMTPLKIAIDRGAIGSEGTHQPDDRPDDDFFDDPLGRNR